MLRRLTVEMDVSTNIDGMSEMRSLLRDGLSELIITDVRDSKIREIIIIDSHGIDRRQDDQSN